MQREMFPVATAKEVIQGGQLAALALVTHPDPLLLVPKAGPMEKKKNAGPVAFVFLI